jgi:hypothetical protein
MQLGDFFSEEMREQLAFDNLKIGSVLFYFDSRTTPPKAKRKIVVGFDKDKILFAYVRINSEINPNVFPTSRLRDLHIELDATDREYLDYTSYVDCSQLQEDYVESVIELMKEDTSIHFGCLSNEDCETVLDKIKQAFTIEDKLKIKFGLK